MADDDDIFREVMADWLRISGFQPVAFASGDALLEWARAGGTADLVLLDVEMPGRDGFETCRELRAIPTLAATPAAIVTARTRLEVAERAQAAGGCRIVRKDEHLVDTLLAWMAEQTPGAQGFSSAG